MSLYQIWDVPSSTLLLETRIWKEVQDVMTAYVDCNGYDILDSDIKVLECRWRETPRVFTKSEVIKNILGRELDEGNS